MIRIYSVLYTEVAGIASSCRKTDMVDVVVAYSENKSRYNIWKAKVICSFINGCDLK